MLKHVLLMFLLCVMGCSKQQNTPKIPAKASSSMPSSIQMPESLASIEKPTTINNKIEEKTSLSNTAPNDPIPSFSLQAISPQSNMGYQGKTGGLWTVDHDQGTLFAIDASTGKTLSTVKTWPGPHDVLLSQDGSKIWVGAVGVEEQNKSVKEKATTSPSTQPKEADNGQILVFDTKTLDTLKILLPGRYPGHLAMRPDGRYIFASLAGDDAIAVIDANEMTVLGTLPVGQEPRGLAISPDGKRLIVACSGSSTISVLDMNTLTRTAEIPVAQRPTQVIFSPDSSVAYVVSLDAGLLQALDLKSSQILWNINVGFAPGHMTIEPKSGTIFLSDGYQGNLFVINPKTQSVSVKTPSGEGAHGIAISADHRSIYVSNGIDSTVSVFDTKGTLIRTTPVTGRLRGIATGPIPEKQNFSNTTQNATTTETTSEQDPKMVRFGRSVFRKYCDSCHPSGQELIGPRIKGKRMSRRRIINQVRFGSDIMPAFDKELLRPIQLEAIIAYLAS